MHAHQVLQPIYPLVLFVIVIVLPAAYLLHHFYNPPFSQDDPIQPERPLKTIMQAPKDDIAPPKDDPFTLEQLKAYDGTDKSKPIYVAIKGTVFDVSSKRDVYGPGKSYGIFAGKDASKGLGMSSLQPKDAVPDYSGLDEKEMGVLNDWHTFFSKRYNIVGRVTDQPPAVANL